MKSFGQSIFYFIIVNTFVLVISPYTLSQSPQTIPQTYQEQSIPQTNIEYNLPPCQQNTQTQQYSLKSSASLDEIDNQSQNSNLEWFSNQQSEKNLGFDKGNTLQNQNYFPSMNNQQQLKTQNTINNRQHSISKSQDILPRLQKSIQKGEDVNKKLLFQKLSEKYKRNYQNNEEYLKRYKIFLQNYDTIIEHNRQKSKSHTQGFNSFFDLSDSQFQNFYFMKDPVSEQLQPPRMTAPPLGQDIQINSINKINQLDNSLTSIVESTRTSEGIARNLMTKYQYDKFY